MKVIVAAGVATAVAIGSLGYIAGAKSASGATADPFAVSAFEQAPAPAPAVAPSGFVARPAPRPIAPRPVSDEPAPRVVSSPTVVQEQEPVEPKRSWKKTAIIIGAGAGSGAVVGGIIDGKKGAGIGAAIGGGAASVYEVLKRR
jgi:hypothetical protein